MPDDIEEYDDDEFALGDLLNRVLDRGMVVNGKVIISIADVDLVYVDLHVLISSMESIDRRLRNP